LPLRAILAFGFRDRKVLKAEVIQNARKICVLLTLDYRRLKKKRFSDSKKTRRWWAFHKDIEFNGCNIFGV